MSLEEIQAAFYGNDANDASAAEAQAAEAEDENIIETNIMGTENVMSPEQAQPETEPIPEQVQEPIPEQVPVEETPVASEEQTPVEQTPEEPMPESVLESVPEEPLATEEVKPEKETKPEEPPKPKKNNGIKVAKPKGKAADDAKTDTPEDVNPPAKAEKESATPTQTTNKPKTAIPIAKPADKAAEKPADKPTEKPAVKIKKRLTPEEKAKRAVQEEKEQKAKTEEQHKAEPRKRFLDMVKRRTDAVDKFHKAFPNGFDGDESRVEEFQKLKGDAERWGEDAKEVLDNKDSFSEGEIMAVLDSARELAPYADKMPEIAGIVSRMTALYDMPDVMKQAKELAIQLETERKARAEAEAKAEADALDNLDDSEAYEEAEKQNTGNRSTTENISKAEKHAQEALRQLANGQEYGILHNDKYGEIKYPLGKMGKKGFGFLHIVENRMTKDGKNLDEAIEIAKQVGIAVEIGSEVEARHNTRHLDYGNIRAIIALMPDGNKVLTGYEIRADESPVAKQRADELLPQHNVRSDEIVAALKNRLFNNENNIPSSVKKSSEDRSTAFRTQKYSPDAKIHNASGETAKVVPVGGMETRNTSDYKRQVKGQYAIVDADTLITSNNADPNVAYPEKMQNRDRANEKSSAQVTQIAVSMKNHPMQTTFKGSMNEGVPVVVTANGADGKARLYVLSGNGRTMATRCHAVSRIPERF